MSELDDAKARAARVYDAASDRFDDPANGFWDNFGRRTVERLGLVAGDRVIDVCCGSGASALPAAEAVGPTGSVLGVDLSEGLLALARAKARARGFAHAEFRRGDMTALEAPDASADAVICVFGIFFVPDMSAATRELWRTVAPGGRLAITTWGPRWFEPATTVFWAAVREVRPELYRGFNPWDRVCEPESLREVFENAGVAGAEIVAEAGVHTLGEPEDWWAAVLGSGYRATVDALEPLEREHVRRTCHEYLAESGVREIEANVVYGVATKRARLNPAR